MPGLTSSCSSSVVSPVASSVAGSSNQRPPQSLATTVKYVYPFMTPVSDFGEQKKRMERIRREVEWRRVGCELEECENDF